jgi:uncharacterized protein (DUF58 family)
VAEASPWRGFVTAAAGLAGLLGFASGAPALLGFAAGWAMLLALAFVAARLGLGGLAVERRLPASALEGDLVTVDLSIENRSTRTARFVLADDRFGAGLADRQSILEPGPLPPLHRRVLSYRAFTGQKWGLYTVGPLSVGQFDPLGLFFARRDMGRLEPFEVYPRPAPVDATLLGGRPSASQREATAAAAGQSLLYRGVREFHAGDDVRRIHWPATARHGTPMVREHERDLQPVFLLFLDLERRGRAGIGRRSTLEYLVRVSASLLWMAHRRGDTFGLVTQPDGLVFLPPAQGEAHLGAALHQLVIAKQSGSLPLLDLVERHRDLTPPGSAIALVASTTELDLEQLARVLDTLRTQASSPLVVVIDALAFPPVDRPPTPIEAARDRRAALAARLLALDLPAAILGPDDAPEEALARPGFLARLAPTPPAP